MTTLAIDIGGIKLTVALISVGGQIRDRRELPMSANRTPEVLRDALSTLISPLQAHAQRVAIASTGTVHDSGLSAFSPHNLGGLLRFPLVKTLKQPTSLSIIAINDMQATTWVGLQALNGDITGMVFITVSTGVDDGVVSGCKLLASPGGLVGHIGHMLIDPHGPVCDCGRAGCVEAIVSGCGTTAAAQGGLAGADTKIIFARAEQDGGQAQQLIHRSARTLARLIADIKTTTDCRCVVVGGSVSLAKGYLALVETYLAQESVALHVDLLAAHYHHGAGLLGATLLAQGEKLR